MTVNQLLLLGVGKKAAAGGGGGLTLIARTHHDFVGGAETFSFNTTGPGGTAAAGDLVIAHVVNAGGGVRLSFDPAGTPHIVADGYYGPTTDPDGYTHMGYVGTLTTADITSGQIATNNVHPSGGGFAILLEIWRGASSFTFKGDAVSAPTATTLVFAGYSPSGSTKGTTVLAFDSGPGTGTTITGSPGTWTQNFGPLTASYFVSYGLTNSIDYTNATVTFSGFSAQARQTGLMGEFT